MLSLSPTAPHQKLLSTEFCNFCSQQISQACSVLKDSKNHNFILLSLPAKNETIQSNDVIATIDVIDAIDDDILEKFVVG